MKIPLSAIPRTLIDGVREHMEQHRGQKYTTYELAQLFETTVALMTKVMTILEKEGVITSIERNYNRMRLYYAYTEDQLELRRAPLTLRSSGVYKRGPEWKMVDERLAEYRRGVTVRSDYGND